MATRTSRGRCGWGFCETMERRVLLNAAFFVTNANDSGSGSLRQAILNSNADSGDNTIAFEIGSGAKTINLKSSLPTITQPVGILGGSQPGFGNGAAPLIQINGATAGTGANGFTIDTAAGGTAISNFCINRFSGDGILIEGVGGNAVYGNYIGTNSSGTAALPNGGAGVYIADSPNNQIGDTELANLPFRLPNVISGNTGDGIVIAAGFGFSGGGGGNKVFGNDIGTNAAAKAAIPNGKDGIFVQTSGNTIGSAIGGNIISGNDGNGIELAGLSISRFLSNPANGNSIQGNAIGASGAGFLIGSVSALPNDGDGIRMDSGTSDNNIGGTAQNTISGNLGWGINLNAAGGTVAANQISDNLIGVNPLTQLSLPNTAGGVEIAGGASGNFIGSASSHNVISGNTGPGISISGATSTGNQIIGDYVGVSRVGTFAVGNGGSGLVIGTSDTQVGGTAAGDGNVISGNGGWGVQITAGSGTTLQGNFIGTNAAGNAALSNVEGGVQISSGGNTVGGTAAGARNVISGNTITGEALEILSATTPGNTVLGNFIGLNAAGTASLGNSNGIVIKNSPGNTIGGTTAAARNVITGAFRGIWIMGSSSSNNLLQGNYIGTNPAGTSAFPNSVGIEIDAGTGNIIGGTAGGAGNLISGNSEDGIDIAGSDESVEGNLIGTNAAGTAALGNGDAGVVISGNSVTVGGTTAAARNIISGNGASSAAGAGIVIGGSNNVIEGNYIGTNITGSKAVPNVGDGIEIEQGTGNFIGTTTAGAGNVISANSADGVYLDGPSSGTMVEQNYIGTNAAGTGKLGNGEGVLIDNSANNVIGSDKATDGGNVISGNGGTGIRITGTASTGNHVHNDLIGTDKTGKVALGNFDGVLITIGPSDNFVGGTATDDRNVIAGSANEGIEMFDTRDNSVQGNYIGVNVSGSAALGNGDDGIFVEEATGNTLGGTTAAARNVIAGNVGNGLEFDDDATGNTIQGNYVGLNAAGTAGLANQEDGIFLAAANTVGGTAAGAGNLIAANDGNGITLNDVTNVAIEGNWIGVAANGTTALGNKGDGVLITNNASNNTIGGANADDANLIEFNDEAGVFVNSGTGNSILRNSIFSNVALGIDLAPKGVNPNRSGNPNPGPNNLQNYPVLTAAIASPSSISITGTLTSTANKSFTIEFFADPAPDPSGFGQGKTFLGSVVVTTNASGIASGTVTLAAAVPVGDVVTATATNSGGSTSEFAKDIKVTAAAT